MPHVFVSYVREDFATVERLVAALREHGIEVWLDRTHLTVGDRWPQAVRAAIRDGDFFLACFSTAYTRRVRTHMNEELLLAVEELRRRTRDRRWFLPVTIEPCELPDLDLGPGETLDTLHRIDLSSDWDEAVRHLVKAITGEAGTPGPTPAARLGKRWWTVLPLSAVLAAAASPLLRPDRDDPDPDPVPPCATWAARVTAPPTASTTFDVAVDVACPPPPGRVHWLFIRGDGIGRHGTTNYYPNLLLRPAAGRQVTQNFVQPSDPGGERFYVVLSVPEALSRTLTDKREFIGLPPEAEIVSASVRTVVSHPPRR